MEEIFFDRLDGIYSRLLPSGRDKIEVIKQK
jgi:hypothetical protein